VPKISMDHTKLIQPTQSYQMRTPPLTVGTSEWDLIAYDYANILHSAVQTVGHADLFQDGNGNWYLGVLSIYRRELMIA